jgi:hypothetical protein
LIKFFLSFCGFFAFCDPDPSKMQAFHVIKEGKEIISANPIPRSINSWDYASSRHVPHNPLGSTSPLFKGWAFNHSEKYKTGGNQIILM